jgi:hypothetical protein
MANKYHWYVITLQGENRISSSVIRLPTNKVTKPEIDKVRIRVNMPEADIVSVSYLGHMSKDEYETGIPDAEEFI